MADRMAAEIRIGGKILADLVPELCGAISAANVGLEYGEYGFAPDSADDLLAARTDYDGRLLLVLCDDQACWGEFEELEEFLREKGIAYERSSEGKYEYSPTSLFFRPGTRPVEVETTPGRHPIVLADSVAKIERSLTRALSRLEQGEQKEALAALRKVRGRLRGLLPPKIPPLTSLEIVNP